MTRPNEHHDTITSGLRIVAERPNGDGTYSPVDDPDATSPGGTISIIAKDRDGNAVLVTNAHVITGLRNSQPAGGDRVYHHEISGSRHIATVPQWDILRPAWVHRKGGLEGDGNNRMDVGYAVLESGVGVKFALHGHDDQHLPGETINVHTDRRIVPGTYDPSIGDKLVFLGRNSGEHKVTVTGLNSRQEVTGFRYIGLVSFSSTVDLIGGDSGAGLYRKVGDEYQLSCIFFTASNDRRTGYAFRASEAAEALGLTFGNRPPIAHAGPNRVINSNNPVILEGSVDDPDSADRNYVTQNHTWTQDSGPVTITLDPVADEPVHRTFTPEVVGVYFFTLTATDQEPLSASDTVRVSVWPSAQSVLPTRVRATAAARSVDITWTGPSIATGYQVEIGIPPSEGGQNHTFHTSMRESINIGSLIPQKTYEYRVRMTNADGVGPWTDWARTTTPGETPPTPTGDQWDVQYLNNKIQVKVTEIPEVIPAISQVRAKLGISPLGTGLGSDTITVTKNIGTALNRWVDVLTSAESNWQVGTWTAQVRFENTIGDPGYSPGKPVTVPNRAPTANPGYTQAVAAGSTVTLDGSRSSDPDGHSLTYRWEQLGLGELGIAPVTPVTISNSNQATATFVAPNQAGPLSFKLTVTDPGDLTHAANVTIHACSATGESRWYDTGETRVSGSTFEKRQTRMHNGVTEWQWVRVNRPPISDAGSDQVVAPSATVTLDGSGSRDRDGDTLAYAWTQTQGPSVTLTGADTVSPTFTAPSNPTHLRFRLTVTDTHEASDIDAVVVRVVTDPTDTAALTNLPPTANAGAAQTVTSGVTVTLDGSGSSDPDGDTLAYAWKQVAGPNVTLSSATVAAPTFPAPSSGATTLRFRLTVTDPDGAIDTDAVAITVNAPTPPPPPANVTATATANSVTVSWNTVSEATGYDMQLGEIEEGEEIGYANYPTTGLTYTVGNLKSNTRYYYRVRGKNDDGTGPWSDPVRSIVTPVKTWEDTGETRNRVEGAWKDTGNTRENQVLLIFEKEQTRTITWEKERRCANCAAGAPTKWVNASRTETWWVPVVWGPWEDTGDRRNEVTGDWTYTGRTQTDPVDDVFEKEQSRTTTWEKKQSRTSDVGNHTQTQWVQASRIEIRWVRETWDEWEDTGEIDNEVKDTWKDTGETREDDINLVYEKEQRRTIAWRKEQTRTSNFGNTQTQWIPASRTETRWVVIPEECGSWSDTGRVRNSSYGSYSRTGNTRGSGANKKCEESRTVYREKQQSCTTNAPYYNTRYRWVSTTSTTATRWVDCPPPCGPWSDTGNTRTSYGT